MNKEVGKTPRLITIAISHYCEKVRWALERLEIPYIEEPHVSLLHRLATRSSGGGQSVPVLVTEVGTFSDSTEILHYLDGISAASTKLYPADPKLRREVDKLEDLFDNHLGPSTRLWFYFYMLDRRELMLSLFCQGVEPVEQELFGIVFPSIQASMKQVMNITPESGVTSQDKIKRILENVNERLADGRRYLVGDSLSAADITFACLAAPVLMPPEYSASMPPLDEIPSEMAATIEELRETPGGVYALRLFREERTQHLKELG